MENMDILQGGSRVYMSVFPIVHSPKCITEHKRPQAQGHVSTALIGWRNTMPCPKVQCTPEYMGCIMQSKGTSGLV